MHIESDYNDHPELHEGEMFLTNICVGYYRGINELHFDEIKYKTARLGFTAYDSNGNYLSNTQPVFVKKWEYKFNQVIFWGMPIFIVLVILIVILSLFVQY